MSDPTVAEVFDPMIDLAAEQDTHRADYIRGLRELADFLEAHPTLPTPVAASVNAYVYSKAELAACARASVRWAKNVCGNYFYLTATFAGRLSYDVNVQREHVCRKVVTGTHVEPALPAQPAREAREVEDFTWVCEPLLEDGGVQ